MRLRQSSRTAAVRPGLVSSAALAASGLGMALRPRQAVAAMDLETTSVRGVAEARIGLGGTFAGLGLWALVRNRADVHRAVGATWLGAGLVRLLSLKVDEPDTDAMFWVFLAAELTFGVAGLLDTDDR